MTDDLCYGGTVDEIDDLITENTKRCQSNATWRRWPPEALALLAELHRRTSDPSHKMFGAVNLGVAARILEKRHGIKATAAQIDSFARGHLGRQRWSDGG